MCSTHLGDAAAAILSQNAHHTPAGKVEREKSIFLTSESGDDLVPFSHGEPPAQNREEHSIKATLRNVKSSARSISWCVRKWKKLTLITPLFFFF